MTTAAILILIYVAGIKVGSNACLCMSSTAYADGNDDRGDFNPLIFYWDYNG